jgi:phosphoribosylformylglycinamidine (FGAM) synthase PurS component
MILYFSEKVKSLKRDLDAQEVEATQAQVIVILILLLKDPVMERTEVEVTMAAGKEGL